MFVNANTNIYSLQGTLALLFSFIFQFARKSFIVTAIVVAAEKSAWSMKKLKKDWIVAQGGVNVVCQILTVRTYFVIIIRINLKYS